MNDEEKTISPTSEGFESQIADTQLDIEPEEKENYESKPLYEKIRPEKSTKTKSKKDIFTLIFSLLAVLLIVVSIILPWYCISFEMSALFITVKSDMNFHLTELNFDVNGGLMANESSSSSESETISYAEIKEKAQEQGKGIGFFNIFTNMLILLIIAVITTIISLVIVICSVFRKNNKKKLRKIGFFFALLSFIFCVTTAGYFLFSWESDALNSLPVMDDSEGSTDTSSIINLNENNEDMLSLDFWDSKTIDMGDLDSTDLSSDGMFSSFASFFSFNIASNPGLSWYIIIFAGIASLTSAIILLDKKTISFLILILVVTIILSGGLWYVSSQADADDSSLMDLAGSNPFMHDNNPAEAQLLIGNWTVDIANTTGHNEDYNYTEEIWSLKKEGDSYSYTISTIYDNSHGSYSSSWSASDGTLCANSCYSYDLSEGGTKLVLTKSGEYIVLYKTE